MGKLHFEQMHSDAMAVDCRAFPLAVALATIAPSEIHSPGGKFWGNVPFDVLMDRARKLLPLGDWFSAELKRMLLDSQITVRAMDRYGQVHKIRDPRVIDFDDPVISEEEFAERIQQKLPGIQEA